MKSKYRRRITRAINDTFSPHPRPEPAAAGNPVDLKLARALLQELCTLASTALSVARGRPDIQYEEDELHDRIHVLRQSLGRIGWVADVTLRNLGESGAFARAEDWMLPAA